MARSFEFEMTSRAEAYLHSADIECTKNPGHGKFIPVRTLTKDHLPAGCQDDTLAECIQALAKLTVRIRCSLTSPNRPDTLPNSNMPYPFAEERGNNRKPRYATGWVLFVDKEPRAQNKACPCDSCKKSPSPKPQFVEIEIRTAAHHVYDRMEAERTTCDLFFDEGSVPGVDSKQFKSCRIAQVQHDFEGDYSDLTFTSHDLELAERLDKMISNYQSLHAAVKEKYPNNDDSDSPKDGIQTLTVIVSHPHGCSKHITVGEFVKVETMENRDSLTRYIYTTATCPGSSGAPVFVPSRGWLWLLCEHPHSAQWDDHLNVSGFALK